MREAMSLTQRRRGAEKNQTAALIESSASRRLGGEYV
jgi:hypothetical protein